MYARGDTAYELNESAKKQIEEINKEIYDKSDKDLNILYNWGREASIEYLDSLYKDLEAILTISFMKAKLVTLERKL
jgi:hypothetical protein